MIDVQELSKVYGGHRAVDGISFRVRKGEVLGFLGPNGAGKTSTMRVLTCFIPPSSGQVTVGGFDVMRQSIEVRRIIGYQPENPPLYGEMTVREYLTFAGRIRDVAADRLSRSVDHVVDRCGLGEVRGRLLSNLSKGFKQRTAIAQAMIHDPEVLIFDEPTIGLDPRQIIEIRHLIKSLAGDHTVILSTHILPEVTMTCQRVVIINEGRLVAEDTYEGLQSRLRRTHRLMIELERGETPEVTRLLQSLDGVRSVEFDADSLVPRFVVEYDLEADIRADVAKLLVEKGWGLLEMRKEELSLEEVFLKLTTEEEMVQ